MMCLMLWVILQGFQDITLVLPSLKYKSPILVRKSEASQISTELTSKCKMISTMIVCLNKEITFKYREK